MKHIGHSVCSFLVAFVILQGRTYANENGWPLEPTGQDHPLGSTHGELMIVADGLYQHNGIDVLATACKNPCDECEEPCGGPAPADPSAAPPADAFAPWVVVTVGGTVKWLDNQPNNKYNNTKIDAADGVTQYKYYHLAYDTFDTDFVLAYKNRTRGGNVASGARIAKVHPWSCGFDHLHYERGLIDANGITTLINPLLQITPNPDLIAPDIFDIHLANHNDDDTRWSEITKTPPACTVVQGKVDIVAHLRDRDDAGSTLLGATNVGVYDLRWRACHDNTPDCNWNSTHAFKDMPPEWEKPKNSSTLLHFSLKAPWESTANECSHSVNQTFMVPSSHSPTGSWDTTDGPDGEYTVSVEASDIAGNRTVQSILVCVQNDRR
jgi:hypothetical protein